MTRRRASLPFLAPAGGRFCRSAVVALAGVQLAASCTFAPSPPAPSPPPPPRFEWRLPPGFPRPSVPAGNPMTVAKVELGRHLFYDRRLSGNGTLSCAGCHQPERAFTDGRSQSLGSTGELHPRGAMSLANVAYARDLTWADPGMRRLEKQMLTPMFGEEPVELGLASRRQELLERLRRVPRYRELFAAAYPGRGDPVTLRNVVRAIACFERTLISGNAPYDRRVYWDEREALSEAAARGMRLFFSERLGCSGCHAGFTFSGPVVHRERPKAAAEHHNTGLYNLGGRGDYPPENGGLFEHSGRRRDVGRFRAPTLRNIEVTAPYMHDGSLATLEEVIAHYAAGGRTIAEGPFAGVGRESPYKSERVAGFEITPSEVAELVAFLRSLTDREFLREPRYADPWPAGESGSGSSRGGPPSADVDTLAVDARRR